MRQTPHISKPDVEALKLKEVQFCAAGYHSSLSVENSGFKSVLQVCVNLGAKYGKFEVGETLADHVNTSASLICAACLM